MLAVGTVIERSYGQPFWRSALDRAVSQPLGIKGRHSRPVLKRARRRLAARRHTVAHAEFADQPAASRTRPTVCHTRPAARGKNSHRRRAPNLPVRAPARPPVRGAGLRRYFSRPRDGRRPRALPRGGHGRLPQQADAPCSAGRDDASLDTGNAWRGRGSAIIRSKSNACVGRQ